MVEGIVAVRAELKAEAFRDFGTLEEGHIPDVEARGIYDVPAGVGEGSSTGLNEPGGRIFGHITHNIAIAAARRCSRRDDAGCSTCSVIANGVDNRSGHADTVGVDNGSIPRSVAVSV